MSVLVELQKFSDAEKALKLRQIHKIDRPYLGLDNDDIDSVVKAFQKKRSVKELIKEARSLWSTDIFEARIAAGKILTKGRLQPDDDQAIWEATVDFAEYFDSWAIADHMAMAAHKRINSTSGRWQELEAWTTSENQWIKRAALVYTLPFTRIREPNEHEQLARDTILEWCEEYVFDDERYIQKAVGWWLRDLSRIEPKRVAQFTIKHGETMLPTARKEAEKYLI